MAAAAVLILAATAREWRRKNEAGVSSRTAEVAAGAAAGTAASNAGARSQAWPRRPGQPRTSSKALKHRATPERPKPQRDNRRSAGEIEWATDFLPLPYAGDTVRQDAGEPDAGEFVRIELPRAALTELGLPPAEAAGETVTAEVFIGEDGVARAIRFAR